MPHWWPAPTLMLPAQPNLTQIRKQAKDLLKAFRAGQEETYALVMACPSTEASDLFMLNKKIK